MKYNLFRSGLVLVVVLLSFAVGCNSDSDAHHHNHDQVTHDEGHDHVASTELTLNNGAKWQLDTSTSKNVVELKTMTNMFAVDPSPSASEYNVYGNDMINGINKMIQECTMTGEDDAALHRWFLPIMRQSNELKSISDTSGARNIFDSIKVRVDVFPQYFAQAE